MRPSLLIAGLGNPGKQYETTRHNIGFQALDLLAEKFGTSAWRRGQKFEANVMQARVAAIAVLLAKPLTFMNRSGQSVQKLVSFYKLDPAVQLLVICDDVDLPPGAFRLKKSGGPGTHNGLRSIVDHLGASFPRLRIGIGSPPNVGGSARKAGENLSAYVLSKPLAAEQKLIDGAIAKVPGVVQEFCKKLRKREKL